MRELLINTAVFKHPGSINENARVYIVKVFNRLAFEQVMEKLHNKNCFQKTLSQVILINNNTLDQHLVASTLSYKKTQLLVIYTNQNNNFLAIHGFSLYLQ